MSLYNNNDTSIDYDKIFCKTLVWNTLCSCLDIMYTEEVVILKAFQEYI